MMAAGGSQNEKRLRSESKSDSSTAPLLQVIYNAIIGARPSICRIGVQSSGKSKEDKSNEQAEKFDPGCGHYRRMQCADVRSEFGECSRECTLRIQRRHEVAAS